MHDLYPQKLSAITLGFVAAFEVLLASGLLALDVRAVEWWPGAIPQLTFWWRTCHVVARVHLEQIVYLAAVGWAVFGSRRVVALHSSKDTAE